jgi:hypothetical protein
MVTSNYALAVPETVWPNQFPYTPTNMLLPSVNSRTTTLSKTSCTTSSIKTYLLTANGLTKLCQSLPNIIIMLAHASSSPRSVKTPLKGARHSLAS